MTRAAEDPKLNFIQAVPLFQGLSKKELALAARVADEVTIPQGKKLFTEGTLSSEFFIVIEGTVEVTRKGRHLMNCGPGDYLGDISLIVPGNRRASAEAGTEVRALVMTSRDFLRLLKDVPAVETKVLRYLAARVLESSDHPTS
ncbi:MAG TPA: cyclic nucleotide-binding domain-containing protein [Pedococcus sp.]|jgi:CRP-like cAMP-binding protein|nr:cyclic nucleotide-binding domain-containing protein [Pedococcus sp.]